MEKLTYRLFWLYILVPKIELLPIGGAAIRPEDLIFVLAAGVWLSSSRRKPIVLPPFVGWYVLFSAVCLISSFINISVLGPSTLLYSLRLVEYLCWFWIAFSTFHVVAPSEVRRDVIVVAAVLCLWAAGELLGLVPRVGKFVDAEARLSVNTTGPYEAAALFSMLLFLTRSLFLRTFLAVVLLLTQARITVFGTAAGGLLYLVKGRLVPFFSLMVLFYVSFSGLSSLLPNSRFGETGSLSYMAETLERAWSRTAPVDNPEMYFDRTFADLRQYIDRPPGSDISFEIRAVRWSYVIQSVSGSVTGFLMGWGPGAFGVAVDGSFVRVYGESGLVGLYFFLAFLLSAYKLGGPRSFIGFATVMLSTTGLFIDIFTSSKVIPFFWTFAAVEWSRTQLPDVVPFPKRSGAISHV